MQIFIHDVSPPGILRGPDATMTQLASDLAQSLAESITGLTFTGLRYFIERLDGVDQGLVVIEGAIQDGEEFPPEPSLNVLESELRSWLLGTMGFSAVGKFRIHSLTAQAA